MPLVLFPSIYRVDREDASEIVEQAFISGKNHDVDPLLILAVIATESSFDPWPAALSVRKV